jgi:hypothetical protein
MFAGRVSNLTTCSCLSWSSAESSDLRRDRPHVDEVVHAQGIRTEATNRDRGAVEGERGNDRVDARAIRESRIDHRIRLVDAAADSRDDPLDDAHHVGVVLEARGGLLELAEAFDVDEIVPVHEDIRDGRIVEEGLQGT